METLKYKIIKSQTQYKEYCKMLEKLAGSNSKNKSVKDEMEMLTFLIEKWDDEHNSFNNLNPVELLSALMHDHDLKAKDLVTVLKVSKGLISDILNYKKGLSKDNIRLLADYFKVSQEAFNRPYKLKTSVRQHIQFPRFQSSRKELALAH